MANSLESFLIKPYDFNISGLLSIGETNHEAFETYMLESSEFTKSGHPDLKDLSIYNSEDQTIIPFYAINHRNSRFNFTKDPNGAINKAYNIESLDFAKFSPISSNTTKIPNNINSILQYMFQYWNILSYGKMLSFNFVKDGVAKELFVGPGILMDSQGEVLFCLGFRKELLSKFNSIKGQKKLTDFYKAFIDLNNTALHLADNILNENAVLLFSREFVQKPEYARFYKNVLSVFSNGTRYNMDMIVTEFISKYIYNIPSASNHSITQKFKTSKERNDYFKKITEKSILDY